MFRAVPCSSSGGQIVFLRPLVSSLSVNGRTVCRLRADSVVVRCAETRSRNGVTRLKYMAKYYMVANLMLPEFLLDEIM